MLSVYTEETCILLQNFTYLFINKRSDNNKLIHDCARNLQNAG